MLLHSVREPMQWWESIIGLTLSRPRGGGTLCPPYGRLSRVTLIYVRMIWDTSYSHKILFYSLCEKIFDLGSLATLWWPSSRTPVAQKIENCDIFTHNFLNNGPILIKITFIPMFLVSVNSKTLLKVSNFNTSPRNKDFDNNYSR